MVVKHVESICVNRYHPEYNLAGTIHRSWITTFCYCQGEYQRSVNIDGNIMNKTYRNYKTGMFFDCGNCHHARGTIYSAYPRYHSTNRCEFHREAFQQYVQLRQEVEQFRQQNEIRSITLSSVASSSTSSSTSSTISSGISLMGNAMDTDTVTLEEDAIMDYHEMKQKYQQNKNKIKCIKMKIAFLRSINNNVHSKKINKLQKEQSKLIEIQNDLFDRMDILENGFGL